MKKNDLVKLAIFGLAACLCMSGQMPYKPNQELAMTKCSKPEKPDSDDGMNGEDADKDHPGDMSKIDKQKTKSASIKNKSAAKRVMEGSSNTSMNAQRKSAAQRSMNAETD